MLTSGALALVHRTTTPDRWAEVLTVVAANLAATAVRFLLFRHWVWWAVGAVWVIWMAWSRTYLAAHWLTDVIGGIFLGVAVGILGWAVVETIRRRRAARA